MSPAEGGGLRVWIDAQLPPAMAVWLRDAHGVDATHLEALGRLRQLDGEVFEGASEAGAVILTKDSDFVQLVHRLGPPPQIVWIRTGNTTNADLRRIVLDAWSRTVRFLQHGEALVEIRRRADGPE